jgi:hypothetical protein
MKRLFFLFALIFLAACSTVSPLAQPLEAQATELPSATVTLTETITPSLTPTPTLTVTPSPTRDYPLEGYGPQNFPANVDPLTGQKVTDPALLERRPMIVKVANLPRAWRPQWGLSLADQVFEYYTEEGTTRFAAVFLGQDAPMVGPIRSARFFDNHLITMYNANFAFGSADYRVLNLLFNQNYYDRLVIESACPPMCRYEPNGVNYLMTNTTDLAAFINSRNILGGNVRQNLDGFHFNYDLPAAGETASRVFVRYSSAIYNRWDYDPQAGKYIRFSDTRDDLQQGAAEDYRMLTDRANGQAISADNVVVLHVLHQYYTRHPEIVDIVMSGPDDAYLFRDGQMFPLRWYRNALTQVFSLVDEQGQPFPLKPGNTWFEVVGTGTQHTQQGADWRFMFQIP